MKLYTNVIPFSFGFGKDGKPEFVKVGTTFAVLGADFNGIIVKLVSDINKSGDNDILPCSIKPDTFNIAFKEVEHLAL